MRPFSSEFVRIEGLNHASKIPQMVGCLQYYPLSNTNRYDLKMLTIGSNVSAAATSNRSRRCGSFSG
jgi:hypothetical protein